VAGSFCSSMRTVCVARLATSSLCKSSRCGIRRLYSSPSADTRASSSNDVLLSDEISRQHRLPRFTIPSSKVQLIEQPSAFYQELVAIISRAKRRIFIASLYIGKTETDLVSQESRGCYKAREEKRNLKRHTATASYRYHIYDMLLIPIYSWK
jgi:phosphatidylserine/phosphatidylglycerophosphate/cardiolipin synthase-like enzyme